MTIETSRMMVAGSPDPEIRDKPETRNPKPGIRQSAVGALLFFVLLALTGQAPAQPYQSGSGSMSQTPVFKYYVWGQVRNPGAFSLSANPDIVELISAAGGPTAYANLSQAVLIRASTQKRMAVNLGKVLGSGQVVPLSPGDVVIVRSSAWYYIRDGLTLVTSAASLVTLVLTIVNMVGK
jgi:hypothetical protein